MFDFKKGWLITKRELSLNWTMFIWSTIFMLYMGGVIGFLYFTQGYVQEESRITHTLLDFILLLIAPLLGIDYSRRAFRLWQEDSYRKQMQYYRTLPIPFAAVLGSRLQILLMSLIYNSILVFTLTYVIGIRTIPEVTFSGYLAFVLTTIGFGLLLTALYIYWEYMVNYKRYVFWSSISTILIVAITITSMNMGWNIANRMLALSIRDGLASPLMWIGLIAGIAALTLSFTIVSRKAKTRDLL
ncbi:hypothetical protein ACE3MZ_02395 [Paenibacillus sp. WLX1005]|uniref:hypothetical protein n=1 Tax=Paenibacillus sp. WLX1005 TaxID=3243766 RepID=UPI003984155F